MLSLPGVGMGDTLVLMGTTGSFVPLARIPAGSHKNTSSLFGYEKESFMKTKNMSFLETHKHVSNIQFRIQEFDGS